MIAVLLTAIFALGGNAGASEKPCHEFLAGRTTVWFSPARAQMDPEYVEFIADELGRRNAHLFSRVHQPRIFEIKHALIPSLREYSRALFRENLGWHLASLYEWGERDRHARWNGYWLWKALAYRERLLQREIRALEDVVTGERDGVKIRRYEIWRADLNQELQPVRRDLKAAETGMSVVASEWTSRLELLEVLFADLISVLDQPDLMAFNTSLNKFVSTDDGLQRTRLHLARALRKIQPDTQKAQVVSNVMNVLLDASEAVEQEPGFPLPYLNDFLIYGFDLTGVVPKRADALQALFERFSR